MPKLKKTMQTYTIIQAIWNVIQSILLAVILLKFRDADCIMRCLLKLGPMAHMGLRLPDNDRFLRI